MTRRPRWVSITTLAAAGLLAATLGGPVLAQDGSPAASAPAATPYPDPVEQPPAPAADVTEYPNYGGEVDCEAHTFNGRPYPGNLKKITAPDASTVVFEFCNPNIAFLAQAAFAANAIDDAAYLIAHAPDGSIVTQPNGTGPYKVDTWDIGNRIVYTRNDDYWGEPARTPTLEFRWSDQSAARMTEILSGTVDGVDNPGRDDLPAIESNPDLVVLPRVAPNVFYLGMSNAYEPWDDVRVRQAIAMGIDRQRIVDNFYPPGSTVATTFTPCSIPYACEGEDWYEFDPEAARALLAEAGFPDGFQTKIHLRDRDRVYITGQSVIAQDIQAQLKENLNIDATIDIQESGTMVDNVLAGKQDGIFMFGWGADYPDATNFLDFHFGSGTGAKFGEAFPDLVDVLNRAGQTPVPEERTALYTEANNLIKQYVPMVPVAYSGSAAVFRSDVEDPHTSPLTSEIFAVMQAADRDTFVWMQNAEPLGLYCADETDGESLRACEQTNEALYAYEIGGTATKPSLATECTSSEDFLTWTCSLRDGVTFHDGSTLDASDVVLSYAAQWDALSPLHVGRSGAFEYWPATVGGGFLNPPGPCGLPNTAACE
jgi:ABC-type transport system substrate-binding protein